MNTVEKTATGVTPAQLIFNNSVRLSSQILQSQRVMHPPDTIPLGSHGRMDLQAIGFNHGSTRQAVEDGLPRAR